MSCLSLFSRSLLVLGPSCRQDGEEVFYRPQLVLTEYPELINLGFCTCSVLRLSVACAK